MHLLLTRHAEPFTERSPYLTATGLSFEFDVWRSGSPAVWRIGFPRNGFRAVAAARRGAITMPNDEPADAAPPAHVADVFDDTQGPIVGVWATSCLVTAYQQSLATIRDRASTRNRTNRPVKQARELDAHISSDGFDIAAVTADIAHSTDEISPTFGIFAPSYEIQTDHLPERMRPKEALQGAVSIQRAHLRASAARLALDAERTIAGVGASANLRQTISNTRLQRWIVMLAVLALIVAIVGLT